MSDTPIHPVILSGGEGTRLWPLSRAAVPKQLVALGGETSLLQQTAERVAHGRFAPPLVICSQDGRFLVDQQLADVGLKAAQILLEPIGRNTAPAAAVAALHLARKDPEALILLLPSDHAIADTAGFRAAAETGAAAARAGWLVTFGIAPDRPEVGYGYIRRGAPLAEAPGSERVAAFIEKPNAEAAAAYLAAGDVAWNSGMFLFAAGTLIAEMERLQPAILAAATAALEAAERDLDFLCLDAEAFARAPAISLDHAVMEHTKRAAVVPVDIGWSDLGSWDAMWRIRAPDPDGNALRGDVLALDCRNSYLHSETGLLAALGAEDLVVVNTKDAVLVCPRARAQDVREVAAALGGAERPERAQHRKVYRPWGSYEGIDEGAGFQVKRLIINVGASISLQRHRRRSEHWVVVRGLAEVTRGEEVFRLEPNQSTYIPVGTIHRLHNPGDAPLHIIEVQCGDYLGEDDIERFEDIYGRG